MGKMLPIANSCFTDQRDGLHSHNKRYDTFMPADDDNSRCIGRVIGRINDAMLPDDEETRILEERMWGNVSTPTKPLKN